MKDSCFPLHGLIIERGAAAWFSCFENAFIDSSRSRRKKRSPVQRGNHRCTGRSGEMLIRSANQFGESKGKWELSSMDDIGVFGEIFQPLKRCKANGAGEGAFLPRRARGPVHLREILFRCRRDLIEQELRHERAIGTDVGGKFRADAQVLRFRQVLEVDVLRTVLQADLSCP